MKQRGRPVESKLAPHALATIHPSAILRADEAEREAELQALVDDLRAAAKLLSS
jgi:uracil-DNA glycosylase